MNTKDKILVCVMFSTCIVIGYSRTYILEMEHVFGVDVAFYSGIFVGVMLLQIMFYLRKYGNIRYPNY